MAVIRLDPGEMKAGALALRNFDTEQDDLQLRLLGNALTPGLLSPRMYARVGATITQVQLSLKGIGDAWRREADDLEHRARVVLGEPEPESPAGWFRRKLWGEPSDAVAKFRNDPSWSSFWDAVEAVWNAQRMVPGTPAFGMDVLRGAYDWGKDLVVFGYHAWQLKDRYLPQPRPWESPSEYRRRTGEARERWHELAADTRAAWDKSPELLDWIGANPAEAINIGLDFGKGLVKETIKWDEIVAGHRGAGRRAVLAVRWRMGSAARNRAHHASPAGGRRARPS